jgi:hypothetical protein
MSRTLVPTPLRRTILLIVLAALLLSQALGLLHRVVHAPQGLPAVSVALAAGQGTADGHWLARLFAGHDANACDSYDQLAHADFLWGQPPELCTAAVSATVASSNPAWRLAAQAAGYLARGPPRLA